MHFRGRKETKQSTLHCSQKPGSHSQEAGYWDNYTKVCYEQKIMQNLK